MSVDEDVGTESFHCVCQRFSISFGSYDVENNTREWGDSHLGPIDDNDDVLMPNRWRCWYGLLEARETPRNIDNIMYTKTAEPAAF